MPYTYKNYDWISYENVLSLQEKTEFALKNGLGGGMVWSIETDDFLNVCGNGKYVYLNTIKMVLNSNNAMTTEATTIETSTSKPITETSSTQFFTTKLTTVPSSEPTTVPTSEPTTIPPSKPTTVTPSKPITVPSSEPTTVPSSEPTTIPSSKPTAVPPSACKEPGINKHPTDQHKFISCVPKEDGSYILYEMICPANLIFNDNLKTCAYTNNLLLNDTICKEAGNNKHPTDHHKYYSCIKKADGAYLKYQMSCPENLVYQEKNKICNYPNKG